MFRFLAIAALLSAVSGFTVSRSGNFRHVGRSLEMAKKSISSLSDADLKGKRFA
jgi:hypothetical protein